MGLVYLVRSLQALEDLLKMPKTIVFEQPYS